MRHPNEVIIETHFPEEGEQMAVCAEENVQAALQPIAVGILPRRSFAPCDLSFLQQGDLVSRITEVLGGCQTRQAGSCYDYLCAFHIYRPQDLSGRWCGDGPWQHIRIRLDLRFGLVKDELIPLLP
jgi:hypothetical protein